MYSGDETGGLICDYGSHTSKFGFAGEDCPRIVKRTESRNFEKQFSLGIEDLLCGLPKDDHPVLVTIPAFHTLKERVEWTEIILEKNAFPATFLLRSPVASAFASGKSSCLVVELGASAATICPVFEGYSLLKSAKRTDRFGGQYLSKQLSEKFASELPMPSTKPKSANPVLLYKYWDTIDDIKHTCCKLWKDTSYSKEKASELGVVQYRLPDGQSVIELKEERFEFCESLFEENEGVGAMLYHSLAGLDADLRKSFAQEILCVGGAALLQGFPERLGMDISRRIPLAFKPRVLSPGSTIERRFAPFVGGSVLASLGSFQQLWLSKKEWTELGEKGVDERFVQ